MIYISERQKRILDCIIANPGLKYGEIYANVGNIRGAFSAHLKHLSDSGLVIKKGKVKKFNYFYSGKPFTVGRPPKVDLGLPVEDHLLQSMADVELSETQHQRLLDNLQLPRRQLATMLGISKLQLNQYMEQHGIKSKYKPIREEQL